jgi:hypothetical protein
MSINCSEAGDGGVRPSRSWHKFPPEPSVKISPVLFMCTVQPARPDSAASEEIAVAAPIYKVPNAFYPMKSFLSRPKSFRSLCT